MDENRQEPALRIPHWWFVMDYICLILGFILGYFVCSLLTLLKSGPFRPKKAPSSKAALIP
jgi:hypothetical protein